MVPDFLYILSNYVPRRYNIFLFNLLVQDSLYRLSNCVPRRNNIFFKIFWFQTFQWRSNIFAFNILVPDFLFRLFNVTKLHTYPLEMYWSLSIKRNIDVFHSVYGFRENWWTSICMFIKVKFENIFNIILKSNICFKIHLL